MPRPGTRRPASTNGGAPAVEALDWGSAAVVGTRRGGAPRRRRDGSRTPPARGRGSAILRGPTGSTRASPFPTGAARESTTPTRRALPKCPAATTRRASAPRRGEAIEQSCPSDLNRTGAISWCPPACGRAAGMRRAGPRAGARPAVAVRSPGCRECGGPSRCVLKGHGGTGTIAPHPCTQREQSPLTRRRVRWRRERSSPAKRRPNC